MTIVPDAHLFEGHFDSAPILPGVAQIALALSACATRGLQRGVLTGLSDVRFSRPVGPGDAIDIVLDPGQHAHSIRFEIRTGGRAVSSGLLLFAAE